MRIRVRVTQIYARVFKTTQCRVTRLRGNSPPSPPTRRSLRTRLKTPSTCHNSKHHYHIAAMSLGSRASKRTHSQSFPEEDLLITRSQPIRSVAPKRQQSRLAFGQSAVQEHARRSTPLEPRQRSLSQSPSQASSIQPSESASIASRPMGRKILATKRISFEVDLTMLDGVYRTRTRTIRQIHTGKISWIYLHGIELEKKDTTNRWHKYWLCKPCFDGGKLKALSAASTSSCGEHLRAKHSILPPGAEVATTTSSSIDPFVEQRHPFAEERWQTAFINWITKNDITFEAAADPALHEVILLGGPSVRHLLPSRPTIRRWLLQTYDERLLEVKESLATARSRVTISIDGWSAGNDLALLGVVGHWVDKQGELKTALLGLRHSRATTASLSLSRSRQYLRPLPYKATRSVPSKWIMPVATTRHSTLSQSHLTSTLRDSAYVVSATSLISS